MSSSARSSNDSSWGRRRSFFALSNLKHSHSADRDSHDDNDAASSSSSVATAKPKTLIKKHKGKGKHLNSPSRLTQTDHPDVAREDHTKSRPPSESPKATRRPSLTMRTSKRPPSVFEMLKSNVRSSSEELLHYGHSNGEPLSTTSSKAPSLSFENALDGSAYSRSVIIHGEVQTSAGMFRKKKEYLVLTETQLLRYKSQAKAADNFKSIQPTGVTGRSPNIRHGSMPSFGSNSDLQTLSDSSGDKDGRVLLRQVVAVHRLDEGRPYFALEICWLDEESGQASAMTLQFNNPEERDLWLIRVRAVTNDARLREPTYMSSFNLENAARIVERDNDYHPDNCAIFKVVQRQTATKSSTSRSSSDDLTKVASTVCFLTVGVHKVHLIQLVKPVARTSSPSLLAPQHSQTSHGILTLMAIKVSALDDGLELTFRQPLQKPKTLYLASSASHEIAARLHFSESFLRPECGNRLFRFIAPADVEDLLAPPAASDVEEHSCLDRTLIAYCVAYGVNPANVRYTINYNCEDAPRFELLPPADPRRSSYGPLELLAIMRALRYNESFGSLSFSGIALDSLNGLHDNYGQEHVCSRTKRGTPIKLSPEELSRSSLLVQEIRALAATSKKLRRMDFSNCITSKHATTPDPTEEEPSPTRDIGCGVVEALFPLCKHQTTNVDWVCLNGINLSDTDLDYLVGAAVDKSCHFRAIELNRCGLSDRTLSLILDALRAQENTLESLEIAGNGARLNPGTFDSQLGMFGFIRKLNLSNVSRTSSSEPFLQPETLLIWRLQELRLSGTTLNPATIDAVSTYLAHPQSSSLHELYLDHTYLSGSDVATIFHSLAWDHPNGVRNMHLDISQCFLTKGLEQVTQAISRGLTPSHLSMRAIEYREELQFRRVLGALTSNRSIKFLDMSQTALPGDAGEETCRSLNKLLAENDTLVELDISGDDSRLATSKFGTGINDALNGLKSNKSIQVFRVEKQKLGFQGASTLAEVLRSNKTLLELHCDNNEIPLHGLTDLVNALIDNTTLVFLPTMNDGRTAAFKSAEATMKVMADLDSATGSPPNTNKNASFTASSAVKRSFTSGFANVKKTAARTTSIRTPSFPALPRTSTSSSGRSSSSSGFVPRSPKHSHSPSTTSITAPLSSFTVQDIQTTHRLLSEQWDRQCFRLEQYLHRNWCLMHEVPVDMEIEDEKFERPSSVGSVGKMLEQVRHDTTPKAELNSYFTKEEEDGGNGKDKRQMSFKHFILEGAPTSPESEMGKLKLDLDVIDRFEDPGTPTQGAFSKDDN